MRIKIIAEDRLLELKSNNHYMYPKYGADIPALISEQFDDSPFLDTKYEIEDFDLDLSEDKPRLTDFENVCRVYSRLMFLTNSEASDERLWAWFCLDPFWKYVKYRWKIDGSHKSSAISDHFFFGQHSRRSFTRNAVARLWWIGRLTYDPKREDPYELTRFVCDNQDIIQHILERNISNNIDLVKPFIQAVIDSRNKGLTVNTNDIAELMKYYNLLGGTYILDFQTYEWIYKKMINRIEKINYKEVDNGD